MREAPRSYIAGHCGERGGSRAAKEKHGFSPPVRAGRWPGLMVPAHQLTFAVGVASAIALARPAYRPSLSRISA